MTAEEIRAAMEPPVVFASSSSSSESSEEPYVEEIMPMPILPGPKPWPPSSISMVIDDGGMGYTEKGQWSHFQLAGYDGDFSYAPGAQGNYLKAKATWSFTSVKSGKYDVYVTWVPYASLTTSAPYSVRGGHGEISIDEIDQTQEPVGIEFDGRTWQKITTVTVPGDFIREDIDIHRVVNDYDSPGEPLLRPFPWPPFPRRGIEVTLTNNTDGYVLADGVLIMPFGGFGTDPANLFVTQNTIPTGNHQLLAGELGESVLSLDLRTKGDDVDVTFLRLSVIGGGAGVVDRLELSIEGQPNPIGIATRNGCDNSQYPHSMCARLDNQQLVVPEGQIINLRVAPKLYSDEEYDIHNTTPYHAWHYQGEPDDTWSYPEFHVTLSGDTSPGSNVPGDVHKEIRDTFMVLCQEYVDGKDLEEVTDTGIIKCDANLDRQVNEDDLDLIDDAFGGVGGDPYPHLSDEMQQQIFASVAILFFEYLSSGTGDPQFSEKFDLDHDGDVDAMDLFGSLGFHIDVDGRVQNIEFEEAGFAVKARTVTGNNTLNDNDGDTEAEGEIFIGTNIPEENHQIAGDREQVVSAKISSISNANPDADGTNVPIGVNKIARFKFSAAKNRNTRNGRDDAVLDAIVFTVDSENVSFDPTAFEVLNASDETTRQSCYAFDPLVPISGSDNPPPISGYHVRYYAHITANEYAGSVIVLCPGLDQGVVDTEINAGEDLTIALRGKILMSQIDSESPSSLQVSLKKINSIDLEGVGIHIDYHGGGGGIESLYLLRTDRNLLRWKTKDAGVTNETQHWVEMPEEEVNSTLYSTGGEPIKTGNLFIGYNSEWADNISHQLLGGELSDTVMHLEFTADKEAIDVTQLAFNVSDDSIDRLELYRGNESTPFAMASSCGTTTGDMCAFMASQQLLIATEDNAVDIFVRARVKSDVYGGVSGKEAVITLLHEGVSARGNVSSNNLVFNDGDNLAEGEIFVFAGLSGSNRDIDSEIHTIVMSKVVSITNANPDAGGTSVPVGVSPVGQFKFTAAAHDNTRNGMNDFVLDGIIFDIVTWNVQIEGSSFRLYNKNDATEGVTCLPYNAFTGELLSGTLEGRFGEVKIVAKCDGLDASPVNTEIDEGSDETFVLEMNILDPNSSPTGESSALQVTLQQFETYANSNFDDVTSSDSTHIKWLDTDAGGSSVFYWIEYPETAVSSTSYGSGSPAADQLVIHTESTPGTHAPDATDVHVVNVDFKTDTRTFVTGEDVRVNEMYLMIQAEKANGTTLACGGDARDEITENVEDVEFRNTITGLTVDAVLVEDDAGTKSPACAQTNGDTSTTAIYRLDDFVVHDKDVWELQWDFLSDAVQEGDKFHVYMCTAEQGSTTGCDFLFTDISTAYNMDVEYLESGEQLTRIAPGHTVQSHDQTIALSNSADFTVNIDGPATQDYTPDDNDAVLANVTLKQEERIEVNNMYALVQGAEANGDPLNATITDVMEDVELRNIVTGRTIDGLPVSIVTPQGTKLYVFSDFLTQDDSETWELRADFIDNGPGTHPQSGDKFRVHICTTASTLLEGCTFGGFFTPHPAYLYNLEAYFHNSGELVRDIRPGDTVSGNFHRISEATLTVTMKSIGSSDVTVENAQDINLLRFEARAGEGEDILFTKAVFEETGVDSDLLNIQNYALWVDTDGDSVVDTLLEDGVSPQSGNVSFADLAGGGYVIPIEETVVFEVHGDVSSSLSTGELQLTFEQLPIEYIEAEELDDGSSLVGIQTNGNCSSGTCQIFVTTTDSMQWSFRSQGDLYVTKDTTPIPPYRQYLGGELGEPTMRIQFRAEIEAVDVTDLQLTAEGDAQSIDRLELYKAGESTPFALATIGGCGSDDVPPQTFCANMESRQLVVGEGDQIDVLVRPKIKNDVSGGVSGDRFSFRVDGTPVSDEATGRGAVRARGDESSNNLSANDEDSTAEGEVFIGTSSPAANNDITENEHAVVMSKVVSITNANEDPNGSEVPVGTSDVGQFKIAAADHDNSKNGLNDVVFNDIIFSLNATNVELEASDFRFYNKADSIMGVTCVPRDANGDLLSGTVSGSMNIVCEGLASSPADTEIDQGDYQTFVLEANITNPNASPVGGVSTLQVSLQRFNSSSNTSFGISDSHVRWFDQDTTSTAFLWIDYPENVVKSTSYQS